MYTLMQFNPMSLHFEPLALGASAEENLPHKSFFLFHFSAVLGLKLMTLCMQGKYYTTELCPDSQFIQMNSPK
jgi:hypothetical protein